MIRIDYRWEEIQPLWLTHASVYARKLGMHGDDENRWLKEELGVTLGHWYHDGFADAQGPSIIFENDEDYTWCMLRWA